MNDSTLATNSNTTTSETDVDAIRKRKIQVATNAALADLPYLSGLAALADVRVDSRIEIAGVLPSGKILVAPAVVDELDVDDLAFILAHELLHLSLDTFGRSDKRADARIVNIAHDYIINDMLMDEMDRRRGRYDDERKPPLGGLFWDDEQYKRDENGNTRVDPRWKPASEFSLEEMVVLLKTLQKERDAENASAKNGWDVAKLTEIIERRRKEEEKARRGEARLKNAFDLAPASSSLGAILAAAGIAAETDVETTPSEPESRLADVDDLAPKLRNELFSGADVFSRELEAALFPDESPEEASRLGEEIRKAAVRAVSEKATSEAFDAAMQIGRGYGSGNGAANVRLLRGAYRTPWEAAIQRWFDSVAPGVRSWARPSRRGAFRTDVVLPGRAREGWTLHIVLDTSGSMVGDPLRRALGAIAQFCQNAGVDTVHILQCDTAVAADEYVEVGVLEHFKARGFGGSDMSPAMLKLAEDPTVEAVVVLTDGGIGYPNEEPPYETLWCIVDAYRPPFPYGTVVNIDPRI